MKAKEVIKSLMSDRHITQGDITKMMDMKSQSAVSGALNRDMKITTLTRFLTALICELIIRDKDSGREYMVEE